MRRSAGAASPIVWSVEGDRIAVVDPSIEIIPVETFPSDELIRAGVDLYDIKPAITVQIVESLGIRSARVPGAFPLRSADALRSAGVELVPDQRFFDDRRRRKTEAELDGIRRATRAGEAGMAVDRRAPRAVGACRRGSASWTASRSPASS